MKTKRKPGRPSIECEPRTARVMVRLMPAELQAFEEAAKADNRKVADWLRLQGLKAALGWEDD